MVDAMSKLEDIPVGVDVAARRGGIQVARNK
jgi:hypothetical protein